MLKLNRPQNYNAFEFNGSIINNIVFYNQSMKKMLFDVGAGWLGIGDRNQYDELHFSESDGTIYYSIDFDRKMPHLVMVDGFLLLYVPASSVNLEIVGRGNIGSDYFSKETITYSLEVFAVKRMAISPRRVTIEIINHSMKKKTFLGSYIESNNITKGTMDMTNNVLVPIPYILVDKRTNESHGMINIMENTDEAIETVRQSWIEYDKQLDYTDFVEYHNLRNSVKIQWAKIKTIVL